VQIPPRNITGQDAILHYNRTAFSFACLLCFLSFRSP
jgi:hypothetical protein